MPAKVAYNLTDDVALVVHLLAKRVPRLAHLRPAQVIHGITQARNRSCHACSHGAMACWNHWISERREYGVRGQWV